MTKSKLSDVEKMWQEQRATLLEYLRPISQARPDMTVSELLDMVTHRWSQAQLLHLVGGACKQKKVVS